MITEPSCGVRASALGPRVWAVAAFAGVSAAGAPILLPSAEAKSPGARYCFNSVCHRVMTLSQTKAAVGQPVHLVTSFYDDCRRDRFNPCGLTSSGEAFRPGMSDSAASPIYPDGTVLLVRNPAGGESAVIRINNAGPYWGDRKLDLSRAAASKLGLNGKGVATVEAIVLKAPSKSEARYLRNRRYDAVAGHIGSFASLSEARLFAASSLETPIGPDIAGITLKRFERISAFVFPTGKSLTGTPSATRRVPTSIIEEASREPIEALPLEHLTQRDLPADKILHRLKSGDREPVSAPFMQRPALRPAPARSRSRVDIPPDALLWQAPPETGVTRHGLVWPLTMKRSYGHREGQSSSPADLRARSETDVMGGTKRIWRQSAYRLTRSRKSRSECMPVGLGMS